MKIPVEIVKCDYCGKINILIDDYGECTNRCPGMFTIIKEKHFVEIPENVVEEILREKKISYELNNKSSENT